MMIDRRDFTKLALFSSVGLQFSGFAAEAESNLDAALRSAVTGSSIPAVTGIIATADRVLYSGAFGTRDAASHRPIAADAIFAIASMTKPITTVAAMQLVERGKLRLHEAAETYLGSLRGLQVFEGFDNAGKPILRKPSRLVTIHDLLTHTSGFAYESWDEKLLEYSKKTKGDESSVLVFDPGTRWQYGTSLDELGKIIEHITGANLEAYFQSEILGPLGMKDTSYNLPPEKFPRLVSTYERRKDGKLEQNPYKQPAARKAFYGGGGLYSTAPDYVRFMQMILNNGTGNGHKILSPESVALMSKNQIGNLVAGKLKSYEREYSEDVDFNPGGDDKWGYGFLISAASKTHPRSAGSLSWAGLRNTFFWIDPHSQLCAVLMMHLLPFCDSAAIKTLNTFEQAAYSAYA
jgi:methyl acetate hydrolase